MKTYTDSELESLKLEFAQLSSIDEKLSFWKEKFRIGYLFWSNYPADKYSEFWIKANTPEEIEYINSFNLNEYLKLNKFVVTSDNIFDTFNTKLEERKTNSAEQEAAFLTKTKNVTNIKSLIKSEINAVDRIINRIEDSLSNPDTFEFKNSLFNSYNNYLLNNKLPDYTKFIFTLPLLIGVHFGSELAKYRLFLEGLLEDKPVVKKKKESTTISQQILALHFLGVIKSLRKEDVSDKKIAEILSIVLNSNAEDIRKKIRTVPENNLSKNDTEFLKSFEQLLTSAKLELQAKEIKNHIDK